MVKTQLPSGKVVLINKESIPIKAEFKQVSQTTLEQARPKRVQSEAQKANTTRLVALAKQRALERRGITEIDQNNIPKKEDIPEGKELVYIKQKKASTQKPKAPTPNERRESLQGLYQPYYSEAYTPKGLYPPHPQQFNYQPQYIPQYVPVQHKPTKVKAKVSKAKSYYEDTDTETETETEPDTDFEIERLQKKIEKKVKVVEKINNLQSLPQNRHSVFK